MTKATFFRKAGAAVFLLSALGCGGGGGGGSQNPSLSATGRSIVDAQRHATLSIANSGTAVNGTLGDMPSLGGFAKGFATTVTSRDAAEGEGFQDFFFEEWLQLWTEVEFSGTTYKIRYYQDKEKKHPAGHATTSFSADWSVFPRSYSYEYEVTAGPLAGIHGKYEVVETSDTHGSMSYENGYQDGSSDSGDAVWSSDGSTTESQWKGADGSWYRDKGAWKADGSGTLESSTSEGMSVKWTFNADGSGSALFDGPDPKLPATMTWDAAGHSKITYADGTSEEADFGPIIGGPIVFD